MSKQKKEDVAITEKDLENIFRRMSAVTADIVVKHNCNLMTLMQLQNNALLIKFNRDPAKTAREVAETCRIASETWQKEGSP